MNRAAPTAFKLGQYPRTIPKVRRVWNPRRPLLKSHQFGGRLAQLGERIVRNDEAGGSNPLPSTNSSALLEYATGKLTATFRATFVPLALQYFLALPRTCCGGTPVP